MTNWFWLSCSIVLFVLAIVDYWTLWNLRNTAETRSLVFSPFTLAAQGAFAVFAGLFTMSLAVDNFQSGDFIMYGELVFLALMTFGGIADWRSRRSRVKQN